MLLVTGGRDDDINPLSSTEVSVWGKQTVALVELECWCLFKCELQYCWETNKCKLLPNQVAVYSAGSPLVWRVVEGGELPSPRAGLRATMVSGILYVTGGDDHHNDLTSVLSWNPAGQTWQEVGNLTVARAYHAAVAFPAAFITC